VTGLVYVAIVALWAAVLIPMWLRRHDDDHIRRIERHRVAMGTLARMSDDAEASQDAAARRRRLVVVAAATLGAVASGVWIAGLLPGIAVIVAWLPLVAYLPAAVLAERRASQRAARAALEHRRARRDRRTHRAEPMESPATINSPPPRTITAPPASAAAVVWDDVFDQTA
jgi:hypothetical protein